MRVGGRTSTVTTSDKHWIDVGGAYVGPGQRRILRAARELGVRTEPVYTQGRSVMMVRGERTECEGSLPSLGPRSLIDVNAALAATEKVSAKVNLSRPWSKDSLDGKNLDIMTMEEWLQHACETEDGREMYRALVRDLLCVEASDVSALFWMWYLHSGQGIDIITGVQGGAQEAHFTGGSQQISDKMRDKIGKPRVLTDKAVVSIDWLMRYMMSAPRLYLRHLLSLWSTAATGLRTPLNASLLRFPQLVSIHPLQAASTLVEGTAHVSYAHGLHH